SMIVNRGDDILHTRLREIVAEKLNLGLDTLIRKIPMIATDAIANAKSGRTIELTMKDVYVDKCDIRMGKEKIHFLIDTKTRAAFRIKHIKPGKHLRINTGSD
ncbi:MAG: DUF4403 family protein, partial [Chlorobiaceae bacterium]|nr:DUF4403 family protein [Chlorobiaceae bacterium]